MASTTIYEFNYNINSTKVNYQISPYRHSANPAALWPPYTQPSALKCSSFNTNQYAPPIQVYQQIEDIENFVPYNTSSSQNLHRQEEVHIVFFQNF